MEGITGDIIALLVEQANCTVIQLILENFECKLRCTGPGLNEYEIVSLLLKDGSD